MTFGDRDDRVRSDMYQPFNMETSCGVMAAPSPSLLSPVDVLVDAERYQRASGGHTLSVKVKSQSGAS